MDIRIAFALSHDGAFEKKHFGDADKYQIYHLNNDVFQLLHEEVNPYKSLDETAVHGAKKKADQIIKLLKEKKVSVLVSRQFGKNIQFIANHFIPVKVKDDTPAKVEVTLLKHMRWLKDELDSQPDGYKLFVMDSGVLKTAVQRQK